MSNIAIKGATTGTGVFTLESPATNTDRTLVLPDEAGTVLTSAGVPASAMPAGSVIQVVQSLLTTTFSTTSSSFVDTGLSLSITPSSASNKILIQWSIPNAHSVATASNGFNLVRDGSNIAQGTGGSINLTSANDSGGSSHMGVNALVFLDSPSTTSAITYKVQIKRQAGGTGYINRSISLNAGSDVYQAGSISTLIAMEVAE